jgi:hypothetical protein
VDLVRLVNLLDLRKRLKITFSSLFCKSTKETFFLTKTYKDTKEQKLTAAANELLDEALDIRNLF